MTIWFENTKILVFIPPMIITEFFAHLRALGFYDDTRDGAREALRLDLQGRGYLLIMDDSLPWTAGSWMHACIQPSEAF